MDRQEEEIHLLQHEPALPGAREQQATSIPALHSHYAASYSHAEKFVLPSDDWDDFFCALQDQRRFTKDEGETSHLG